MTPREPNGFDLTWDSIVRLGTPEAMDAAIRRLPDEAKLKLLDAGIRALGPRAALRLVYRRLGMTE